MSLCIPLSLYIPFGATLIETITPGLDGEEIVLSRLICPRTGGDTPGPNFWRNNSKRNRVKRKKDRVRDHAIHLAEFRANMARITEELVAAAMHPRRLTRYLELGGEIDDW